jgi:penicillin V acylase-like amidase (Ntn superfamily)
MKHLTGRIRWTLCFLACALPACNHALACTAFVLHGGGRIYYGRNLDWFSEDGLVLINPRGVRKSAFVTPGNQPAQ